MLIRHKLLGSFLFATVLTLMLGWISYALLPSLVQQMAADNEDLWQIKDSFWQMRLHVLHARHEAESIVSGAIAVSEARRPYRDYQQALDQLASLETGSWLRVSAHYGGQLAAGALNKLKQSLLQEQQVYDDILARYAKRHGVGTGRGDTAGYGRYQHIQSVLVDSRKSAASRVRLHLVQTYLWLEEYVAGSTQHKAVLADALQQMKGPRFSNGLGKSMHAELLILAHMAEVRMHDYEAQQKDKQAMQALGRKGDWSYAQLGQLQSRFVVLLRQHEQAQHEKQAKLSNWGLGVAVVSVLLALAVGRWVSVGILARLEALSQHMWRRRHRHLEVSGHDEVSQLGHAFNHIVADIEAQNQRDQEQAWVNEQLMSFMAQLPDCRSDQELAQAVLQALCPRLQMPYGVMYGMQRGGRLFDLLASYGMETTEVRVQQLVPGEGPAGQCIRVGLRQCLHQLKLDHACLLTGLGQADGLEVVYHPISLDGKVVAVLELASLQPLTDQQIALLDAASERIAGLVQHVQDKVHGQQLLKQTRSLTQDLKRRQKDLEAANAKLEEGSRYKSEFLANMSHELKTPLNSLLILAQNLLDEEEPLSTLQRTDLEVIHCNGKDLLDLVNDILDLSQVEAGVLTLQRSLLSLADIAESMKRVFRPLAGQKDLVFEVALDPGVPHELFTDGKRLQQILKNLISNALKFTEHGQVRLNIRPSTDGRICFQVSDTGIGISEAQQKTVFDAFVQGDGGINREYGGTGLGLNISASLASLLEGELSLDSVQGQGSTFSLYLPYEAGHAEANDIPVASSLHKGADGEDDPWQAHGMQILLVIPDLVELYQTAKLLEGLGVQVTTAENVETGLLRLDEKTPLACAAVWYESEQNAAIAEEVLRAQRCYEHTPLIWMVPEGTEGMNEGHLSVHADATAWQKALQASVSA